MSIEYASPTVNGLIQAFWDSVPSDRPDAARDLLDAAGTLDLPAVDRYAIGEALLRASNATIGWDLYDLHPSRSVDQLRGVIRWDGSECDLLVIVADQGFGDAIQFLRF